MSEISSPLIGHENSKPTIQAVRLSVARSTVLVANGETIPRGLRNGEPPAPLALEPTR